MTSISEFSIIVAAKDQVSCDLAGETAILNLKDGIYYGLNPVGARIWDLIRTPMTMSEIRDTLLREYDVDPVRCERDLLELVQKLADVGLIKVDDATPV